MAKDRLEDGDDAVGCGCKLLVLRLMWGDAAEGKRVC